MRAAKDIGAGGIEFLPFYNYGYGTPALGHYATYAFGKPAFVDVLTTALETCKAEGLVMDVALGASQGQGVPAKPLTTGLAVQLVYGSLTVESGEEFSGAVPPPNLNWNEDTSFMQPGERFGGSKLIGVSAGAVKSTNQTASQTFVALDEKSLIDLTAEVQNGQLTWRPPIDGNAYVIFATYERYTNQRACVGIPTDVIANGSWVTDKFSAAGAKLVTEFWEQNILTVEVRELLQAVGQHTWEDSMEIQAALYWSESLLDRFKANRGYDPVKYLPLLFHPSTAWGNHGAPYDTTYYLEASEDTGQSKYLQDYRATLDEGYVEYLETLATWAQSIGLSHSCQVAYNIPVDMLAAIPAVAGPELESLGFPEVDMMLQFVGAAHISRHNIVSTEIGAVQTGGYSLTVPGLLSLFHDAFSSGVNLMVVHGMPYGGEEEGSTWPGYTTFQFIYTEMWSPKQPAWQYMNEQMEYTARTQLALQAGNPKTDVAFYLYQDPYRITVKRNGSDLRAAGLSYEYLSPANIISENAKVTGGELDAAGAGYRAFVLDQEDFITAEAAEKLVEFVEAGLPVVIVGALPSKSIGSSSQEAVTKAISRLTQADYPNLKIIDSVDTLVQALNALSVVPRVQVSSQTTGATQNLYHHLRSDGASDFLYVRNKDIPATFDISIEASKDKVPYRLDAWTGKQEAVAVYEHLQGRIRLQVTLQKDQSSLFALGPAPKRSVAHVVSHSSNVAKAFYDDKGRLFIAVDDAEAATVTLSSGETRQIPALIGAENSTLLDIEVGPWNLTVESWVPSLDTTTFKSVKVPINLGLLDVLKPWSEIPAVQNVSGVGIYTADFNSPTLPGGAAVTIIDFGPVLHTLRTWVNGKQLPPIDSFGAQVDISDYLVPAGKRNSIRVEVSSTLFNAVKARVNYIKANGFGPSVPEFYTTAGWQPHGLVGPVTIKTFRRISM
ncbi:uncharacterized protein B0I36DRAFT_275040 [Microdochium trichocladiopsis]|uniref:Secreted protein n=1 Tax=Microdochium trichocladiopsis TaxID=1682393 RepID=A0A9P9BHM8_9PEZI|nr:uncharacterized protein B0I36DRAFT_275040 [Microdochium trichocladiopsis]KAH7020710.1 hypothetical protein B0I36DRAFT_275040 [Microdochium trichocladiopsis]